MTIPPDLGSTGPAALSRTHHDAMVNKRAVARSVAFDMVDHYGATGQLSKPLHEAARRLSVAIRGSWPERRVTAMALYASSEGGDAEEQPSDEEREAIRARHHATWRDAQRAIGPALWHGVYAVCSAHNVMVRDINLFRAAMAKLAAHWRIRD
jgi:hypothetical protein